MMKSPKEVGVSGDVAESRVVAGASRHDASSCCRREEEQVLAIAKQKAWRMESRSCRAVAKQQ